MQEANKTNKSSPKTLEESQALIASLLRSISEKDALIATQAQAIDASLKKQNELQTKVDEHTATIQRLLGIYQKRRERFDRPRPLLGLLGLNEAGEEEDQDEAIVEAICEVQDGLNTLADQLPSPPPKNRKKRNYQLPSHWPRVEVPYVEDNPNRTVCPEHGLREIIGYDIRETAVMEPARFYVKFVKVPKYKCHGHPECGIQQQPAPEGLVKGNKIDTSIGAQIMVQKYMFHVPVYRTEDLFASSGWTVARGTLLNILSAMAYLFEGLYYHYRNQMTAKASLIATDDTVVKLILPDYIPPPKPGDKWSQRTHEVLQEAFEKDKQSLNARMWAYRSEGACPWDVFDFTISRHRDGPERFLESFREGTLLGDCYAGFESLQVARNHEFDLAACNAHARRKLSECMQDHPKESAAFLAIYRQLYDVESSIKSLSSEEKASKRQEFSLPLFDRINQLIASLRQRGDVLPKSKLGKAIGYLENNWDQLTLYLRKGDCPIDNNECEQLMKHTATGRKNWLFLGSLEAGYRAAILTTICVTAHRHNLDVYAYVKGVADLLLSGSRDYESMQAENWAVSHPEHVRQYREQEARYAADRRQTGRDKRRREALQKAKSASETDPSV